MFHRKFESETDLSNIRKMFQKMKQKAYVKKKEKIEVVRIKSTSMVEEKRKKKYLKYVGLVKNAPASSRRVGQMNFRHERKKKEIMDKYLHKV